MKVTVGPEPTERQERQREATYQAEAVLRQAGFDCEVRLLACGERAPAADSAVIVLNVK